MIWRILVFILLAHAAWAQQISGSGSSSIVSGATPLTCTSGTTGILYQSSGNVACDSGFTYQGAGGQVTALGRIAAGNGLSALNASGIIQGGGFYSTGLKPTASAGACSGGTTTGGAAAGTFVAPTCSGTTLTLTFASGNVGTGWNCILTDRTTPTNTLVPTATVSTTAASFTATTTTGDVISYLCTGY
jgi:hypothetical protein